jgi:hypothetical protein
MRVSRSSDSDSVPESVSIPKQFNGPLESGQGGYCSGIVAGLLGATAEVSLRRPVPLDTPLGVVRESDGSIRLLDGETLIADAHAVSAVDVEVPEPVSPEQARLAARRYRGPSEGLFSRCFVCGRVREDALGVFAGPVEGRRVVASPWTPPPWTADSTGRVRPEFVWAVLDCPTAFALRMHGELAMVMLARFAVRIDAPILAGEEHVAMAWPIEAEGRKHHAGSALLSTDGEILAVARALMIEPRDNQPASRRGLGANADLEHD